MLIAVNACGDQESEGFLARRVALVSVSMDCSDSVRAVAGVGRKAFCANAECSRVGLIFLVAMSVGVVSAIDSRRNEYEARWSAPAFSPSEDSGFG